jgi:hypothetical protein
MFIILAPRRTARSVFEARQLHRLTTIESHDEYLRLTVNRPNERKLFSIMAPFWL